MILVLIGAPGAGKGTQADLLSERLGFRKVSTGDALRKQVKIGTEIGKRAEAVMSRGELVSDEVLLGVVQAELGVDASEVVILDGYPRNLTQAETLRQIESVHSVKGCIHLDVKREDIIARLSGRRVCSGCGTSYHVVTNPPKSEGVCDKCGNKVVQRPDDEAKSIAVRLDVYDKNTEPVLDFYRKRNLYWRVNGFGSTEEIFQELREVVSSCIR